MPTPTLKLKQASAVLDARPKDLQNLVQFGVVRPRRARNTYWFDVAALLEAKAALTLKESLGAKTEMLARLTSALRASGQTAKAKKPERVRFTIRTPATGAIVRLSVPLRSLETQIQQRMPLANLHRDLPRGRKRPGWKQEILSAFSTAAAEMGTASEEEIQRAVRAARKAHRRPEITVAPDA